MGVQPNRGTGASRRPLLRRDIEIAQANTRSGHEAARYLKVNYGTYRKYAKMYGLFEQHINSSGRGISRKKTKGLFGLDSILAGEHPNYDRGKLKERLINAGYLSESCSLCGFNEKRIVDGRCPLVLHTRDGSENLNLDNLELRCYNCTYLTTGRVADRSLLTPASLSADMMANGLTMDDIAEMQDELMQDD